MSSIHASVPHLWQFWDGFIAVKRYFCPYLLPLYRVSFATMKHYMRHKIRLSHVRTLTYRPPSCFSIRKCKLGTQLFMCFIVWTSGLQMRQNIGVIYLCGFLTPVDLTERRERRRDWILDDCLGFVSWLDLDGPSLSVWMNAVVNYDYVKICSEDRRGLSVIKVGDDWGIYCLSPSD